MEYVEDLLELTAKHGAGPVAFFVALVFGVFIVRGIASTWNAVTRLNASGRNQLDQSTSGAIKQLADSNHELAAQLSEMVKQNNATLQAARDGTLEQAKLFNKSLDRMEGMLSVLDDQKKSSRAMSNTLNEVNDRIGPIQTDLRDVSLRTAGLASTFTALLDERLTPMLTLLISMNTQVNTLAADAKANGQGIETVIQEAAKVNDLVLKIIAELSLLKDLFFDRDEHLSTHVQHIINTLNIKEIPQP